MTKLAIQESITPVHYEDTFTAAIHRKEPVTWDELNVAFGKAIPAWTVALLYIRNLLVGWTGLKTGRDKKVQGHGLFDVFTELSRTEDVAVLGDDDRHLNFRVIVRMNNLDEARSVAITTQVHFNRREGRVYFFFVKPFHKLIVWTLTRRIARVLSTTA